MKSIKLFFGIGPKTTSEHPTDDASDDGSDYKFRGKPRERRLRRTLRNIRIFIFGSALEEYSKPVVTSKDCYFVLITLHINIRFVTAYIDLSLEWGGALVWFIFSMANVTICHCLAFLYTFLGCYGDRSFLNVWEMIPFFSGLMICVCIFEMFKLIETSILLSSGFSSFVDYFSNSYDEATFPIDCANHSVYRYQPGYAVPYGLSYEFIKDDPVGPDLQGWEIYNKRCYYTGAVWLCVVILRIFQFKRYRLFPVRVVPLALLLVLAVVILANCIIDKNPVGIIIQATKKQLVDMQAYLQLFAFSMGDYLPMHWVTIGYLNNDQTINSKIWVVAAIKILVSFFLLFWIPYVAEDFRDFTNVARDECLHFFGIHFIFVMIPNTIRKNLWYVRDVMYVVYFFLIELYGLCSILLSVELFSFALSQQRRVLYRYRNLIYVILCIGLYIVSIGFCVRGVHYFLFFINYKGHFYTIMVLVSLTTIATAVYGVERLHGDHLFLFGSIYGHISSLKIHFVVNLAMALLTISELVCYDYRTESDHVMYWSIFAICVLPFLYGVVNACSYKKQNHGYMQPLTTWGVKDEPTRSQRRSKTMRTMFTYRMKRDCIHNCLLNHPNLMLAIEHDVKNEIALGVSKMGY